MNNPSIKEMYMVPILIATFNNQIPIKIEPEDIKQEPIPTINYLWEWKDDNDWKKFGFG